MIGIRKKYIQLKIKKAENNAVTWGLDSDSALKTRGTEKKVLEYAEQARQLVKSWTKTVEGEKRHN